MTECCKTEQAYILLTRHRDPFSRLFSALTGDFYTHASIGLEEGADYCSFTIRGFCREDLLRPGLEERITHCALYALPVTPAVHEKIDRRLARFLKGRRGYGYSYLGLLFCLLHIPHRVRGRYFCSQFVSETLAVTGAGRLYKAPSLCRPDDMPGEARLVPCFEGSLQGFQAYLESLKQPEHWPLAG